MEQQRLIGISVAAFGILLLLILAFVKVDVDEQGAFLCEMVAENPNVTMDSCPAHQSNSSWLLSLGFGLSFLIAGGGVGLAFLPPLKGQKTPKKTDLSKLDDEERQLFTIIEKNEGSAYQSDLIKETSFSKVKVTRIIDRLETKGIVERKRRGMINLVVRK